MILRQARSDVGAPHRLDGRSIAIAVCTASFLLEDCPSLEAEDAWFERGLLDEFCHIAERVGFHRSNFLCRIDVDEDGDSIAHNEFL